ncbi:MAG: pentapeptide repeat-containing protein [Alphaproteobacteria bacterium]|nr:pentapeptide repeat-containing protein [Alphaproteobacteria bacterium]
MSLDLKISWRKVKNSDPTTKQAEAFFSGQTIPLDSSSEAYKFLLSFGEGQEPWPAEADRPCLSCYDFTQEPAKSMLETAAKAGALAGALLQGANLAGIDLAEANLQGVYLGWANLEGARLNGANLKFSVLCLAKLAKANLEETDLSGADLTGADVTDTNFSGSKDF